mmetsp:Transcript_12157/g.22364  ORF Transcript_12157/g.22364 Transcript_12157/m.22364 type:complete len:459 (-) Transcript_12157:2-1378(-)
MRIKVTHFVIVVLHSLLLFNVCYHCRCGGYLDELDTIRAIRTQPCLGSLKGAGPVRFISFWSLVTAVFFLYLAAGTLDPGFVHQPGRSTSGDIHPTRDAASGNAPLLEEEFPAQSFTSSFALAPLAAGLAVAAPSAREVQVMQADHGRGLSSEDDVEQGPGGGGLEVREINTVSIESCGATPSAPEAEAEPGDGVEFQMMRATSSCSSDSPSPQELPTTHTERSCKVCCVKLPLRAKHCHDCGRCVRTHDHHCPWIGNCVGENNRVFFFWFVLLQGIEACWVLQQSTFACTRYNREEKFPLLFFVGVVAVFCFSLALVSLVTMHAWLAAANLTTWEYLRWRRISYLREFPPNRGSPFSSTLARNLALYCCTGNFAPIGKSLDSACSWCCQSISQRCLSIASFARCIGEWLGLTGWNRAGMGGGHVGTAGEIVWRQGTQHVPYLLKNACYNCYHPAATS